MVSLHPTVVVSGATGALGSATAAVLARRQARVIVMARPSDRLDALVESLGGAENRVSAGTGRSRVDAVGALRGAQINRAGGHRRALLNVAAVFVNR